MRRIYSPKNEIELAFIKSLLDGEHIPFYIHNDHFGSMNIGPQIELVNVRTIEVPDEHAERALDIIRNYVNTAETTKEIKLTISDKIRMILEGLLFAWFVPGKKRHKDEFGDED